MPEDAPRMLAYLRACAEETDFLLRVPEEWDIPVETEKALLQDMARQTDQLMVVCDVNGEIAGHVPGHLHESGPDPAPRHDLHRAAQGVLGTGHSRSHV